MSRWALIPVKGFDRSKSRLAPVLLATERAALTRKMLEHVVGVMQRAPSIDEVAIVSDSARAREHARRLGVSPLTDSRPSRGLAEVVDAAVGELEMRGATSVVVCMSDLPELTVEDIESVVRRLDQSDVVLAPDRGRRGTNVVAAKPPSVLPSCLGHEDSLRRHEQRARDLGLSVSVQLRTGIGFDVDRPEDLPRLGRTNPGAPGGRARARPPTS